MMVRLQVAIAECLDCQFSPSHIGSYLLWRPIFLTLDNICDEDGPNSRQTT